MEQKKPQIGVGVIVLNNGKVLLGKRKGSHGSGQWALPGGCLEWKESIQDCAARELLEETGLKALSTHQEEPYVEHVIDGRHYLTLFVHVDRYEGTLQCLEPEKCEGWHWFDWAHLPSPLFSPLQTFLERREQPPHQTLLKEILAFFHARDWDQFHSPKNIVMSLASEVGELIEPFRWLTEEQSAYLDETSRAQVSDEVGDVFMTVVYLAHKLGIDPIQATRDKLGKLGQKYPAQLCRGKSLKYTAYVETND